MHKIVETLRQTEWWYGQDGFPYRLDEMELTHLWNVLNFLGRRASQLRLQHYWDEFLERNDVDDYDDYDVGLETAFHEWLRSQNEIDGIPQDWLNQTPFMQELRHQIALRNVANGDVVGVRYDEELEDGSGGANGRAVGADPRLRDRPALG